MVWSPLNKNFIIISNKDHTIRIWNIEENPPKDKSGMLNCIILHIVFNFIC